MLNTSCKFHFDDVIVASVINVIDGDVVDESIPQGAAFCCTFFVAKRSHHSQQSLREVGLKRVQDALAIVADPNRPLGWSFLHLLKQLHWLPVE